MVSRRGFLAGTGAIIAGVTGSVYALFTADEDAEDENNGSTKTNQNSSDEKAAESTRNESGNGTGGNTRNETGGAENGTQNESNESENETEYPEAANPEPDPQGPTVDNESMNNESRAGSVPSESDVVISESELVTASDGAAVIGVVRNNATEPMTVELRVTFYENGGKLGRPALNGVTDLPPGETWDFQVRAMGSEFSGATDYEIEKHVPTPTR